MDKNGGKKVLYTKSISQFMIAMEMELGIWVELFQTRLSGRTGRDAYKSPNDDNGYDISDYRGYYGFYLDDFDELLAKAREHRMTGSKSYLMNISGLWRAEALEDNSYRNYYIWEKEKMETLQITGMNPGNMMKIRICIIFIYSQKQPDLNWRNEKVREEVYDLDKGIDGFLEWMLLTCPYPDGKPIPGSKYGDRLPFVMNGPHVHEYLQEMNPVEI